MAQTTKRHPWIAWRTRALRPAPPSSAGLHVRNLASYSRLLAGQCSAALRRFWTQFGPVLGIFVFSRLGLYGAALFGNWLMRDGPQWSGKVTVPGPLLLALHWRWDAIHYYTIAVSGYAPGSLPAFFPFYPLLVRGVATLMNGLQPIAGVPITAAGPLPLLAGILVAHGALLLACWLLFQLACEESGDTALARRAVLYAVVFPLAIFYALPYAESLFLAVSVGTFLAARRARWLEAGLWCAAATATRPVGVLLIPVLLLEMALALRRGTPRRAWVRMLGGLLIAPLGIVLYMLYLDQRFGDPFAFAHAQQTAWRRAWSFPWLTLWRGIEYSLHPQRFRFIESYARTLFDTAIMLAFLGVLAASLRRWRASFTLYGILLVAMILASPRPETSVMQAVGRNVMIFFPFYLTLARWGRRMPLHQAIMHLSLPLLGLLAALYARWYFVE